MKLINVVGARPNFMKIAPIMEELKKHPSITPCLVHTGQHYDSKMSHLFFEELKIPKPDIYLEVGSDTHARQTAKIMMKFEDICFKEKPDAIMVVGDVNSTLACSLVAAKLGIKIIHLEAGLRSFDRTMPEEINRIVTDSLADLLLTPSPDGDKNLLREGIPANKIYFVGNIMIDTLNNFKPVIERSKILEQLHLDIDNYILVTLHRPSNVDNKEHLTMILNTLNKIQAQIKVVFPLHPRTKKQIHESGLDDMVNGMKNLLMVEPLGYLDFQKLMMNSKLVVTDSGGIQEETTVLKIPCVTLRENTERPVTVEIGTNELIGLDMEKLLFLTKKVLKGNWKQGRIPEFWDGQTSKRVVDAILNIATIN